MYLILIYIFSTIVLNLFYVLEPLFGLIVFIELLSWSNNILKGRSNVTWLLH